MKTRNGFVSNSSSASFVVLWKNKTGTEEIEDVQEAIHSMFEWAPKNMEKELVDATQYLGKGVFETRDWTSMMNSMADFHPPICYLIASLVTDCYFELVRAEVRDES